MLKTLWQIPKEILRENNGKSNSLNERNVHKLQGKTVENFFVSNWSQTKNWVCFVPSRVRTSNGFFLRMPVDHNKLNAQDTIDLKKIFLSIFQTDPISPIHSSVNGTAMKMTVLSSSQHACFSTNHFTHLINFAHATVCSHPLVAEVIFFRLSTALQ